MPLLGLALETSAFDFFMVGINLINLVDKTKIVVCKVGKIELITLKWALLLKSNMKK